MSDAYRFIRTLPPATIEIGATANVLLTETENGLLLRRALAVLLGALVTPGVILGFAVANNVLVTYLVLIFMWVLVPSVWRLISPGARERLEFGFERVTQNMGRQVVIGVPIAVLVVGAGFGAYAGAVQFVPDQTITDARANAAGYGLATATSSEKAVTTFALVWLSVSNPFSEELFWRGFLFRALLKHPEVELDWKVWPWKPNGMAWWGPAMVAAVLYASYHVVVVNEFAPLALAFLTGLGLVGYGVICHVLTSQFGMITSAIVHVGVDMVVSLSGGDFLFEWGVAYVNKTAT